MRILLRTDGEKIVPPGANEDSLKPFSEPRCAS
jgi:hypothetical protein